MPHQTPIARELKALRESFGESQTAFAERCGTIQSIISQYESGKYPPGVASLRAIADGTGTVAILGHKSGKVFHKS